MKRRPSSQAHFRRKSVCVWGFHLLGLRGVGKILKVVLNILTDPKENLPTRTLPPRPPAPTKEKHFPEFPNKRTTLRGTPKFSIISYWEFPFHLILLPEFPEFSVKWFALRKFNNCQILLRKSTHFCYDMFC